jgi:FecR protein
MTRSTLSVRRSSRSGLLTALVLACAGVTSPTDLQAAPKTGVVAGSGTSAGGLFTAGPQGATYVLPSQARLTLAPGASVRVFPRSQQLQLAPGAKTTTYSFALLRGRVDVDVPAKPKSAVLCSIGKLSTLVGAGQATVLASADKTTVSAVEGDVRTLLSDHWQTLAAGTVAHFGEGQSGKAVPAVPAPQLSPGQRLWFAPGEPVAVSGFAFRAVPGAERYELRLRAKDGSGEQIRKVVGATHLTETFAPIGPGEYQLALRSVDAEGIAGRWSPAEAVRVVGVALPPGGYAADGDIFIGKGQEVSFSNTEGLEMTYEGAGRYVPASQAVSLYRGETTVVSFRVPGSVYPTSARLRPRSLYAQVAIGPSRAMWPKDPIEIVVELKSRGGRDVPDWLELKPEVKLGIEPLEVAFTRDGQRLVGVVPPTDAPGPWVLRVEVKDQFGALLGRDFLEIAKVPGAPPVFKPATRVASK